MAYSKEVVERFESVLANPKKHSVGRFDPKDPMVATGMIGAPACGDVMKLQLILDDDDPFRSRLARAMEKKGFQVKEAKSVEEGLKIAESTPLSLIHI